MSNMNVKHEHLIQPVPEEDPKLLTEGNREGLLLMCFLFLS